VPLPRLRNGDSQRLSGGNLVPVRIKQSGHASFPINNKSVAVETASEKVRTRGRYNIEPWPTERMSNLILPQLGLCCSNWPGIPEKARDCNSQPAGERDG